MHTELCDGWGLRGDGQGEVLAWYLLFRRKGVGASR
jgi:hypothetical protein